MFTMPEFLEDIVKAGIEVTIRKDYQTGLLGFDLNSQAKSDMFLFDDPEDGKWKIKGRYDFEEEVEDLNDVMSIFLHFYRMRDFGNPDWLELLCEHRMLEKDVQTTTTVTYF